MTEKMWGWLLQPMIRCIHDKQDVVRRRSGQNNATKLCTLYCCVAFCMLIFLDDDVTATRHQSVYYTERVSPIQDRSRNNICNLNKARPVLTEGNVGIA